MSQLYRIGVTPECPVHQITIGGQNFTRRSEIVTGYGSETKRREIQGSIVRMDDADVARIREASTNKVIRSTTGAKSVSRVHSKNSKAYSERPGDVDVSHFVYVHAEDVDPTSAHNYAPLGDVAKQAEKAPAPKARRRSG